MRSSSRGQDAKNLTTSAESRAERTQRTIEESRRQARRTDATMARTADTLESVMGIAEEHADPTILERLKGIIDYLRTSQTADENPLIEALREPAKPKYPNGRHDS